MSSDKVATTLWRGITQFQLVTSVGLIDVVVFGEQHYYGLDIAHGPHNNSSRRCM